MALSTEIPRSFRLYVTHVDGEGHFLRISGQLDQQASLMVESLFETARENLEKGIGAVSPGAIHEGIICAAKYKDGTYYRAKVINMTNIANGLVGVHFIDFGNKDIISLSTIRFLDNYDPMFLQLRGQATDFYLSRVINPSGRWEEPMLMKLQSLLCYSEYPVTLDVHTQSLPIISIQFNGNDFSTHLVSIRFGMAIPIAKQEVLLLQMSENQHMPNWQSNFLNDAPAFSEHVPFLLNQNFPANPASAMRLQQNVALPFNGNIPATPSLISKRLLNNSKSSRTAVNLRAPIRQPQNATGVPAGLVQATPPPATAPAFAASAKPTSPKKSTTYKSRLLEVNSQHKVFVSYADEGPELFAVQLVSDAKKLQDMMDDINRRPHSSLTEPPMIGTVCLGRMSGDRIICRAIVMNLSGSQCKLFFVDFGDTEMVSYYDIFDIPEEFVKPNVFAMRFCLSGVKKLEKGPHLNEAFKQLASGNVLTLKVVSPEGPPLIQYGELYLDNKNILDLLLANMKDKLQFKWLGMLPMGARHSVLVSYVDSCIKFYVQLSDKIDELTAVMEAVKMHCENSSSPGELPVGASCCARFPDDGNWYRARVKDVRDGKIIVAYVDYGNEQEVSVSDLRTITPELIRLPAVAMKCALKGFENRPVETKTSNQLEMLALEKTLMAHVVGVLSSDTMLVTLVDDTVSPPLDVARKMNQLSQPRSSQEIKATTPVRKDAPDSFSSPEGSVPEDGHKRSFRRENSFKDERRSRDGNEEPQRGGSFHASSPEGSVLEDRRSGFRREKSFKDSRRPPRDSEDFSQRGGSFRSRDKDSFDRSGPGRHSEKFGGKPDRGERNDRNERRAPKPWESAAPAAQAPLPADDDWEETPSTNNFQPPAPRQNNRDGNRDNRDGNRDNNRDGNRDNRDGNRERRKPREQHDRAGPRPGWKKDGGVGKRLKQAAEAASSDSQTVPRASVQDRLRRDNRFNQEEREERRNDDWGNRAGASGGREGRPDRRDNRTDNRGERRDNWGDRGQKRDFGNKERSDFGNRDRNDFGNKERSDFGNRDRNDFGNKDRNDFGNRDRSDFGNRDRNDFGNSRGGRGGHDRPRSNFTPRDRAERSFDDNKSDKSFRSQGSDKAGRAPPFKPRTKFTQVQYKEIQDPVPLETPFEEPSVELGAQHEVSVTWIISPESFYTQILSLQPKFLEMMHKIPELYKGVKPYSGNVPVGASVLARYPADGVLYRATVVSVQPFSKFIVRYVDFGNKQLVDVRDIWQMDRQLMELPKMAVHCSLIGVAPKDGEWKADSEIDLCFNAPRYQCVFQEIADDRYKVSLWNNGVSVADTLVEKQLAIMSEHQSSVTLKDEPIDMTIIVGQQILCRVTHVESYEKFTVQLDIEKAALVEETIANFDMAKLTPPAPELIVEGTHCTVKHDGKVCRAVLQDTTDKANIRALLADYGNEIVTSVDNVMILPTELSVYYYQALQCCLNNYTAESETLMSLEEMKEKLIGNKFIVYVNDVDGITLVTTLYDPTTGQKIAIFTPDEGAYDEVVPLCMRAVFNYNFGMAYVSHAENLNEFYLQKSTDGDRLAVLLDELYKFYEEGTPEPATNFEVDALCAARSTDGNWYRATIVSVEGDQAKVHFTDYGNSETVAKDSLKKLDSKFFEPCALALVASLGLVALQDDALAKLTEWTTEKEVQVTLSFGADGWLASLHLDGVDLSMKLINEKLAAPRPDGAEEEPKSEPAPDAAEEPAPPDGCTQAYISHIDTPGHFWLQALDTIDKLEEMQAELQAAADSYPDVESRELGALCAAKYLADERWYRAEILDADADITTVRFVDYGNTDVLDNRPGLIKALPERLERAERLATRASVNAVPTGTGEWTEAASDHFAELAGDLAAPVHVRVVLRDATTYVDVFVRGASLTDQLVAAGHAARADASAAAGGDLPSCFASHVNSPSEFWIQLEAATAELQAMEAAMADAEALPELAARAEGALCAARYPEDGAWYRAQVIVDGSEGTEVLFMDYGNASIASELRALPDELRAKPALSRKCALQKPRDIKSWSRRSEIKFNELAAEGATIFKVQFIASGDISIVELYLDGRSVTEELVGLGEERPAPLGQALSAAASACYVHSLDEFYVHARDAVPEVERVTAALAAGADLPPAPALAVGALCAAFWPEDERWYRARVLEFCDVGCHVQFIDYGNKARCEEFRALPADLAALEPLAKCCRLAGAPEDKSLHEMGRDKLNELALEDVTFRIEYLDSTKEPTLVKVLVDGVDLVSILKADAAACAQEPIETIFTETIVESLNKSVEEPASSLLSEGSATEISAEQLNKSVEETSAETIVERPNESVEETVSSAPVSEEASTEATAEQLNKSTEATVSSVPIAEQLNKSVEETIASVPIPDEATTKSIVEQLNKSPEEIAAPEIIQNKTELAKSDVEEQKNDINVEEVKSIVLNQNDAAIDKGDEFDDAQESLDAEKLNTSQPDLDESIDSTHTVIENKSFEAQADSLSDDIILDETDKLETPITPEKDVSAGTLESSADTIKTPEREESRDSLNTDTGYMSSGEHDKSIDREVESPKNEQTSRTISPESLEKKSPESKLELSPEKKTSESTKLEQSPEKNIVEKDKSPEELIPEAKKVESEKEATSAEAANVSAKEEIAD